MKWLYKTFILLIFIMALVPDAISMQTDTRYNKCYDAKYKKENPDKCVSVFSEWTAPLISGMTVVGGALALISTARAYEKSDNSGSTVYYQSTLPIYNMVGGDIDSIHLASTENTYEYQQNFKQYSDIRLSYSIARGYTGEGTTIAVLDAGLDTHHGSTVAAIASGPIAPNATVNSYPVAKEMKFLSYDEIGDIISHADNADIFNASWSVPMRANNIISRQQLMQITGENFVQQLSSAAERGAIFVWAAGNDGSVQSSALSAIPSVMPEMIGHFVNVVAWDSELGTLAEYSNACGITSQWCITAPGTGITTDTTTVSGTSFAAPIVSAAIAVIREAFPYMGAEEITSLLFETARDLGEPGIDPIYGHGMLDLECATRPVGVPLIPIDGGQTQELRNIRVSGTVAHNILNTNPQFAYFDKYGRAFNTNLSEHISIQNPGIGFQRLRRNNDIKIATIGNIEMGLSNSDIFIGDGMLQTDSFNWFSYIGTNNEFNFDGINIFQRTRISFGTPKATENSAINHFSNIYTASIEFGAKFQDWSFGVSVPDTIISGNMNLRLPINRTNNGEILYKDYEIDIRARPAIEYSVSYKNISASFVDNPYGKDEIFILTRGKIIF